jgi:hypothetical protein
MQRRLPIVPEDLPLAAAYVEREQRRSLVRAATAVALGAVSHRSAEDILRGAWPGDDGAKMVLRAAVAPTLTTSATAISVDAIGFLTSMAPASAAVRLFERALHINLAGIDQTNIGRLVMPAPGFVAEGSPIPVVSGTAASTPVGPARKLAFIVGLSSELEFSTPENASAIIGRALADAAMKQLDVVVFDAVAGDATRPAGLLNGVTPITATGASGNTPLERIASDIANLAQAIANAGISTADVVLVAGTAAATKLKLLAGPLFDHEVIETTALAGTTVVAIAPAGVASGFDGTPRIESSTETTIHFDSAPAQIGTAGTPNVVAAPTRSLYQTDTTALKVRIKCSWATVHPGAVQVVNSVTW